MATKTSKGSIMQMEKGKPKGKCRKWRLQVSIGKDLKTGKYLRETRVFQGTWSEAQKELVKFIDEIENGSIVRRCTWIFDDYVEHYIGMRQLNGDMTAMSLDATKKRLASVSHLIGRLKMQEITPSILSSAYIDLRKGNSKSGKKLCGTPSRP